MHVQYMYEYSISNLITFNRANQRKQSKLVCETHSNQAAAGQTSVQFHNHDDDDDDDGILHMLYCTYEYCVVFAVKIQF